MLRFVLNKLLNKKWMAVCLLIGNLLLIAVAASNPTYSAAILQRTLTKMLSQTLTEDNVYPAKINVRGSANIVLATEENLTDAANAVRDAKALPEKTGIGANLTVEEYSVTLSGAVLQGPRGDGRGRGVSLGYLTEFQEHSELIAGSYPNPDALKDGIIEAVASQRLLLQLDLQLGEILELEQLQPDGQTPYSVKIVGAFVPGEGNELYWNGTSEVLSSNLLIDPSVFEELFGQNGTYPYGMAFRCSIYLDYLSIAPGDVEDTIRLISGFQSKYDTTKIVKTSENLTAQLQQYQLEESRLNGTLTVLQVPIFVLLAAFIFMVSKQMLELEENEIAVLKSRGFGVKHIITVYVLRAVLLGSAGFVLGYPLNFLMCSMLGSSNAFLEFVQRSALPIHFVGRSLVFALVAMVVACGAMTLPVLRYTKLSIVQQKVKKQTGNQVPWWQKAFVDVILLVFSLYALYSFNNQQEQLARQMAEGGSLDPLLYFSSSVFIVGAGLLGIRIVPYLIRLIYLVGKKWWKPATYTSFLRVLRTRNDQSFIMLFVILTISLGIFNMTTARSVNGNGEAQIVYQNGADVVVREIWEKANGGNSENYVEPSYQKYNAVEGVESFTKVYLSDKAVIPSSNGTDINNVTLMGINTKEFGQTATFDESLLSYHWYHHLNAISQNSEAVLLSSSFQNEKGYKLGDVISYKIEDSLFKGVVYGFVDYWPGFATTTKVETETGEVVESANYLIVTHLSALQAEMGVQPYQIWLNMEGSSQPMYQFAKDKSVQYTLFRDTAADLINMKNEPVYQGTNGVLTSNFIIVLLLCSVGFLIYWILSIRSRELQFGIFRAMGMSMGEIITMLVCEQLLISGSSILIGVGVGTLATKLYLPLIQLAYSADNRVLPIRMISYSSDGIKLFAAVGLMIVVCMTVLAWLISKIRIAQALKLGED